MSTMQIKRTGLQCVSVSLAELLQLSKTAKKFSLSALRIKSAQAGLHLSRLLGRGMEFAESRRYQAGDDIRNIDWRVTARTGKTYTKLFAAEKERQVLLLADMRSSMFFATQGVFKSVQAALMISYVAWNASQTGNRVGGVVFDEGKQVEFRPAMGKRGVLPFLHSLAESKSPKIKPTSQLAAKALDEAIAGIERVATPGSLIFIISDFRHLSTYASNLLIKLSRHSDLSLCFIYDQWEVSLPKNGSYSITNGKTELNLNTFDKENLEKYQRQFIERRDKIKSLGEHRHIHFMECSTEEDCFDILKKHFC